MGDYGGEVESVEIRYAREVQRVVPIVTIPIWIPILLFAAGLILVLVALARRKKLPPNLFAPLVAIGVVMMIFSVVMSFPLVDVVTKYSSGEGDD